MPRKAHNTKRDPFEFYRLKFEDGLTNDEIAVKLGCQPSNVGLYIRYAKYCLEWDDEFEHGRKHSSDVKLKFTPYSKTRMNDGITSRSPYKTISGQVIFNPRKTLTDL